MQTTKQRLAHYRKQAEGRKDYYSDWRAWRRTTLWSAPNNVRGPGRQIYSDSLDQIGTPCGDAHELTGLDYTGWYADNFRDDLIRGAVCKMRSSRGTYYIPATYCTGWDGTIHYLAEAELVFKGGTRDEHEEAAAQAARTADRWAEREAEEAREFHAKDQAEQQIIQAREEIHDINKRALELIREIKAAGRSYTPAVCDVIRAAIKKAVRDRKFEFDRITELTANPWAAVE